MKLSAIDYALVRLARLVAAPVRWLGDLESKFLSAQLASIPLEKPLFITGLARSGTTILLEQLVRTNYFATHRYRDFPFLAVPYIWNRYLDLTTVHQQPRQRPHQDRITITPESPEAFEEPLWQDFFPSVHDPKTLHRLSAETRHPVFEAFYRDHLSKLMLIRGRDRYLSKGNYNLTRIEYLGKLFPDALFVVPIRHPFDHVASLVGQHTQFCHYASEDARVSHYLECAGHYEFGPQRRAIRINEADGDRTAQAWRHGDEYLGYAIQWSQVYRFVDELKHRGDALSARILLVRYEDFCVDPRGTLTSILEHAQLAADPVATLSFQEISKPSRTAPEPSLRDTIWREAGLVAQLYGYQNDDLSPPRVTPHQAATTGKPL